jgi:hypothetical protein
MSAMAIIVETTLMAAIASRQTARPPAAASVICEAARLADENASFV